MAPRRGKQNKAAHAFASGPRRQDWTADVVQDTFPGPRHQPPAWQRTGRTCWAGCLGRLYVKERPLSLPGVQAPAKPLVCLGGGGTAGHTVHIYETNKKELDWLPCLPWALVLSIYHTAPTSGSTTPVWSPKSLQSSPPSGPGVQGHRLSLDCWSSLR